MHLTSLNVLRKISYFDLVFAQEGFYALLFCSFQNKGAIPDFGKKFIIWQDFCWKLHKKWKDLNQEEGLVPGATPPNPPMTSYMVWTSSSYATVLFSCLCVPLLGSHGAGGVCVPVEDTTFSEWSCIAILQRKLVHRNEAVCRPSLPTASIWWYKRWASCVTTCIPNTQPYTHARTHTHTRTVSACNAWMKISVPYQKQQKQFREKVVCNVSFNYCL